MLYEVITYQRKGHATKHIELIKQFSDTLQISYINGEIDPSSEIGYDSVKHFYEKNGFKVNGYKFKYSK